MCKCPVCGAFVQAEAGLDADDCFIATPAGPLAMRPEELALFTLLLRRWPAPVRSSSLYEAVGVDNKSLFHKRVRNLRLRVAPLGIAIANERRLDGEYDWKLLGADETLRALKRPQQGGWTAEKDALLQRHARGGVSAVAAATRMPRAEVERRMMELSLRRAG
jgi:hypothetical protein